MQHIAHIFGVSSKDVDLFECSVPFDTLKKNGERAIKNGELSRSPLQKFSYALCNEAGLCPEDSVIMGPIKDLKRILQKAVARYDGDVSQVSDVVRDMVALDHIEEVKAIKDIASNAKFREAQESKGVKILAVEDYFEHPTETTGWRGLVIKLEVDLGKGRTQKAELQAVPRDMIPDYEATHAYLERARDIIDLRRAQGLDVTAHERLSINEDRNTAKKMHLSGAMRTGFIRLETPKQYHENGLRYLVA